ncbi:hypothetical protein B0H14DRAFT_2752881 [Mycena olivaceomarginata]|nr:hypothetical protein B0H14DRAFT_2752881 [Mycena olivaceomarginata]
MVKAAAGRGAANQYAVFIEEAAFSIMDKYFPGDEDLDAVISAPAVDSTGSFAVRHLGFCNSFSWSQY